jgi:hypothetical protein
MSRQNDTKIRQINRRCQKHTASGGTWIRHTGTKRREINQSRERAQRKKNTNPKQKQTINIPRGQEKISKERRRLASKPSVSCKIPKKKPAWKRFRLSTANEEVVSSYSSTEYMATDAVNLYFKARLLQ